MKQNRSFLTLSNKKRKNATLKIKYEIGRDLFLSDNKVSSYPFGAWDIKFLSSRQDTYYNAEINSIEIEMFCKFVMLFNDEYNEKLSDQTFNGWQNKRLSFKQLNSRTPYGVRLVIETLFDVNKTDINSIIQDYRRDNEPKEREIAFSNPVNILPYIIYKVARYSFLSKLDEVSKLIDPPLNNYYIEFLAFKAFSSQWKKLAKRFLVNTYGQVINLDQDFIDIDLNSTVTYDELYSLFNKYKDEYCKTFDSLELELKCNHTTYIDKLEQEKTVFKSKNIIDLKQFTDCISSDLNTISDYELSILYHLFKRFYTPNMKESSIDYAYYLYQSTQEYSVFSTAVRDFKTNFKQQSLNTQRDLSRLFSKIVRQYS